MIAFDVASAVIMLTRILGESTPFTGGHDLQGMPLLDKHTIVIFLPVSQGEIADRIRQLLPASEFILLAGNRLPVELSPFQHIFVWPQNLASQRGGIVSHTDG